MSKPGHILAALAVASLALAAHPTANAVPVVAGIAAGGTLPDVAEFVWWTNGLRRSLIPHRTFTHWPPLWLAIAITGTLLRNAVAHCVAGLAVGALLHLTLDAYSPSGIPLVHPNRRVRLRPLYSTSAESENPFLVGSILVCACATLVQGTAMRTALLAFIGHHG